MAQPLGALALPLPLPQLLYPTAPLGGAAYDLGSNSQCLFPGDALYIPAGVWVVDLGMYCQIEYLDPIQGIWLMGPTAGWTGTNKPTVRSDGGNVRVANRTSCPVGAVISVQGTNYVQATTTITTTPNNSSSWLPIVGGALALSGGTMQASGAGYGVAPLVFIPPPPPAASNPNGVGGIPAAGYCTMASGTVSGFTFVNPGAGYPTAPTATILPSPFDPNINVGITNARLLFTLTGAGGITGVLCTNSGYTVAPAGFTISVSGAGSSASLTPKVLQTVTTASVTGVGSSFSPSGTVGISTIGGVPAQGTITNGPDFLYLSWRPRPAQIGVTTNSNGTLVTQNGQIYDGGLFLSTPLPIFQGPFSTGSIANTGTVALTMGGRPDFVTLQPAA